MTEKTAPPAAPTPLPADGVRIKVDDREIIARKGEMIIEAAGRHGIYIPHYCWHPALSIAGNCRLCLVEIATPNPKTGQMARAPKPVISCQTPVSEGMEVWTHSDMARDCQKGMMEFLLANHPLDCPICDRGGECMLQRYSMEYGVGHTTMADKKRKFRKPNVDPLIDIERNRCIMCTRCVRFCDEIAGEHLMGVFGRGANNHIGTFGAGPVASLFSGNVIDLCPVGCLTSKPYRFMARPWELAQTQSTCTHCAAGCKVTYWTKNGKLYRTTPPSRKRFDEFTLNEDTEEFICNVGRFASDYALSKERILSPFLRTEGGKAAARASWDKALEAAAAKLKAVASRHGADTVAVLVSPRATLEEGYLAARLAREALGTNNVDWRTWIAAGAGAAKAAEAASRAFAAADGDLETAPEAILVINGDLHNQVPITALRIKEMARLRGTKLVQFGHHHDAWLAFWSESGHFCAPGETAADLHKLAEGLKKAQAAGTPTDEPGSLPRAARILAAAKSGLIVYNLEDMGGGEIAETLDAVAALRAALGESWRFMPVASGRNAIGLFATGAQPDRLPGGALADAALRDRVKKAWSGTAISEKAGLSAPEILEAAAAGRIKGLVIFGQDALAAAPDQALVEKALAAVETVVVLDLLPGAASAKADAILPLAAPWENNGTFANIEGNIARLTSNEPADGESRTGVAALAALAQALGKPFGAGMDSAKKVFGEVKSWLFPGAALGFDDLRLEGPGWEFPIREASQREVTGHARRNTPQFNPGDYRKDMHLRFSGALGNGAGKNASSEAPKAKAGTTGELAVVWTRNIHGADPYFDSSCAADVLRPKPYVEISPVDARQLGIEDGEVVELKIQAAAKAIHLLARVAAGPAPGVLFAPQGIVPAALISSPEASRPLCVQIAKAKTVPAAGA